MGCVDWRWVSLSDVPHFAFSAADHQVIAALRDWYENNQTSNRKLVRLGGSSQLCQNAKEAARTPLYSLLP